MRLMDEHLFRLYCEGKIIAEDAIDRSQSPGEVSDKIKAFNAGQLAGPGSEDEAPDQLRK